MSEDNTSKRPRDTDGGDTCSKPEKCSKSCDAPLSVISSRIASEFTRNMTSLWKEEKLCDVDVCVQGRTIPAHRFILASACDYMSSLLAEDRFADSSAKSIALGEVIDAASFECIINWIYTGACEIDVESIPDVLRAASFLQCKGLITDLEAAIIGYASLDILPSLWDVADTLHIPSLAKSIEGRMCEYFDDVINADECGTWSSELVLRLLASDDVIVRSEEDVFAFLRLWAHKQDEPLPPSKWGQLISLIRFNLLSEEFVTQYVETEPLVTGSSMGMEALALNRNDKLNDASAIPRIYLIGDYMQRHNAINHKMRAILIDWLAEVTHKRTFESRISSVTVKSYLDIETLFLSVSILDRYLSVAPPVPRGDLQLVGIVAFYIALNDGGGREIDQEQIEEIGFLTSNAYNAERVVGMEKAIRKELRNRIAVPTAYTLLRRCLNMACVPDIVHLTAQYYLERLLQEQGALFYRPSLLCVACIFLAVVNPDVYQPENSNPEADLVTGALLKYTGLRRSEVRYCAAFVADTVTQVVVTASGRTLDRVKKEYSEPKYMKVALLRDPCSSDI